jgi:hypothetical protein
MRTARWRVGHCRTSSDVAEFGHVKYIAHREHEPEPRTYQGQICGSEIVSAPVKSMGTGPVTDRSRGQRGLNVSWVREGPTGGKGCDPRGGGQETEHRWD